MINLFNYIDRPSPVHRLTGATKLVCLLLWSISAMITYDTRFLVFLCLLSIVLFKISKIKIKDVSFVFGFAMTFFVINCILLYVFAPHHGTEIYKTMTSVFGGTGNYSLTWEQLFYQFNYTLKFLSIIPIVLLFISTTNPSEFAASLNKIGVKYSIAYSVALALRYIPDIQKEYHDISQAQQARGIEMSKKVSLIKRLKSAATIIIPLILTSMDRIEVIANAMELRGFGKNKKRTWYMARSFRWTDFVAMGICILMLCVVFLLNFLNNGRFFNPFI